MQIGYYQWRNVDNNVLSNASFDSSSVHLPRQSHIGHRQHYAIALRSLQTQATALSFVAGCEKSIETRHFLQEQCHQNSYEDAIKCNMHSNLIYDDQIHVDVLSLTSVRLSAGCCQGATMFKYDGTECVMNLYEIIS